MYVIDNLFSLQHGLGYDVKQVSKCDYLQEIKNLDIYITSAIKSATFSTSKSGTNGRKLYIKVLTVL